MTFTVRSATPADAAAILRLINQQAAFERFPGGVRLTEDIIRADRFGQERQFEVFLAEPTLSGSAPRGIVVLLQGYSSWAGAPTMAIHDLFVEEDSRGQGAGTALLIAAARLAHSRGCCRLDVTVLAWNTQARHFYEKIGLSAIDEWVPYRLDSAGLEKLAR